MAENHYAHINLSRNILTDLRQETDSALINALDETHHLM